MFSVFLIMTSSSVYIPCWLCLSRASRVGVWARESAQYDRLKRANQVLCQWDSSANYNMEGERRTSAGSVPQQSYISYNMGSECLKVGRSDSSGLLDRAMILQLWEVLGSNSRWSLLTVNSSTSDQWSLTKDFDVKLWGESTSSMFY